MIKVGVMYPNAPGARFSHEYHRDQHTPLVQARMGNHCKCDTIDKGLASGAGPPRVGALRSGGGRAPQASRGQHEPRNWSRLRASGTLNG